MRGDTGRAIRAAARNAAILSPAKLRPFLSVNRDLFLRTVVLMIALAALTRLSAERGPVVLAANGIFHQLFVLMAFDRAWYENGDGMTGFARQVMLRSFNSLMTNTCPEDWLQVIAGQLLIVYYIHGSVLYQEDVDSIDGFNDALWDHHNRFCAKPSRAGKWKESHYI